MPLLRIVAYAFALFGVTRAGGVSPSPCLVVAVVTINFEWEGAMLNFVVVFKTKN